MRIHTREADAPLVLCYLKLSLEFTFPSDLQYNFIVLLYYTSSIVLFTAANNVLKLVSAQSHCETCLLRFSDCNVECISEVEDECEINDKSNVHKLYTLSL